jgi:hypothetical protein
MWKNERMKEMVVWNHCKTIYSSKAFLFIALFKNMVTGDMIRQQMLKETHDKPA